MILRLWWARGCVGTRGRVPGGRGACRDAPFLQPPKKWVCDALAAWTAGWWPCVHPQRLHFARGAGPWDHNLCRRVSELLHLLQQPSFVLWKSEQLTTPPQGSKVSPTVPPAAPSHPTPVLQPFLGGLLGTKRKTPRGDESWAGIGCCRGELRSRLLRKHSLWLY